MVNAGVETRRPGAEQTCTGPVFDGIEAFEARGGGRGEDEGELLSSLKGVFDEEEDGGGGEGPGCARA